jgi:HSP20 family protein
LRSVRLSAPVDGDKVKADFKKGVLKITLPKKEDAKAKKIQIKAE